MNFEFYSILAQISGMKKGLLYIVALICIGGVFSGCIKNGTNRTINPSMTLSLGNYNFNATDVAPSTATPQLKDTATTLFITGYDAVTGNKVVLGVKKFNPKGGTYSIAAGDASAVYYHSGIISPASGGVIAVKDVSSNTISGYFSFDTYDGIKATGGTYVVGKPWNF